MKELWEILMGKLKEIEPNAAAIGIGITALVTITMGTMIITSFFHMIVEIVSAITGAPVG